MFIRSTFAFPQDQGGRWAGLVSERLFQQGRYPDDKHRLRLRTSRALLDEIDSRFGVFPFAAGLLEEPSKARLGLSECVASGVLRVNPVLFERDGEHVAQFKFTAIVMENETIRLTDRWAAPFAHSKYSIQEELLIN